MSEENSEMITALIEGNDAVSFFIDLYLEGMRAGVYATMKMMPGGFFSELAEPTTKMLMDRIRQDPLSIEEIRQAILRHMASLSGVEVTGDINVEPDR